MILVRHHPGADGTHRVVLLGRLEPDDAPGLRALLDQLIDGLPDRQVRFVTSKLWVHDPDPTTPMALDALVGLARALLERGVPHCWVGCPPEIGAALTAAGHHRRLTRPGPDDLRAGAGWDGVLPLQPAPARDAGVRV